MMSWKLGWVLETEKPGLRSYRGTSSLGSGSSKLCLV